MLPTILLIQSKNSGVYRYNMSQLVMCVHYHEKNDEMIFAFLCHSNDDNEKETLTILINFTVSAKKCAFQCNLSHTSIMAQIFSKMWKESPTIHINFPLQYDTRVYPGGGVCPAPSTYAYSPDMRRADFYPPEAGHAPAGTMAPPPPPGSYYADQRYRY